MDITYTKPLSVHPSNCIIWCHVRLLKNPGKPLERIKFQQEVTKKKSNLMQETFLLPSKVSIYIYMIVEIWGKISCSLVLHSTNISFCSPAKLPDTSFLLPYSSIIRIPLYWIRTRLRFIFIYLLHNHFIYGL